MEISYTNIHQLMDLVYLAGTGVFILAIAICFLKFLDDDSNKKGIQKKIKGLILIFILFSIAYGGMKFNVNF